MNKRLLTVAAFALAGCVTVVAQDKKKEFKMPTGYAGIMRCPSFTNRFLPLSLRVQT